MAYAACLGPDDFQKNPHCSEAKEDESTTPGEASHVLSHLLLLVFSVTFLAIMF